MKVNPVGTAVKVNKSKSQLATLSLVAAGCLWGTSFLFGKIAFREMTLAENVTFRFVFGSIALLPFLFKYWKPLRSQEILMVCVAGVIGVPVQFLVQFKGLQLTTVSHASLIVGTLPILLALGSSIFLNERLRALQWGLLLLSAAGAVLIAMSNKDFSNELHSTMKGDLVILSSMLASVVMVLATKHLMERHNSLHITALTIILGTILLVLWTEIWHPVRFEFSPKAWVAVIAQGVLATAGAFLFWNWGLATIPASRAGIFLNLEPIVGTILGVLVLHETLGLLAWGGGALIIASAVYFGWQNISLARSST